MKFTVPKSSKLNTKKESLYKKAISAIGALTENELRALASSLNRIQKNTGKEITAEVTEQFMLWTSVENESKRNDAEMALASQLR